ncbi:MAG TPA: SRPBCC domain-containing protein [Anaerolineales bacterium]|nr:SRPBCC domain-containing protein [Anaerolineales bacterium]
MADSFEISTTLEADPQTIFEAWLDGVEHGRFIEGVAEIENRPGGAFRIWDGYITGVTVETEAPTRIVQRWRTTEFPEGSPDSRLEVLLEPVGKGSRLTLRHTEIPDGQGSMYRSGWEEHYFEKMKGHFAKRT